MWNILHVDEAMCTFWQCGCQLMRALIGMSLKLAAPNYGPAFGDAMSACWWIWSESALVSTRWESNMG